MLLFPPVRSHLRASTRLLGPPAASLGKSPPGWPTGSGPRHRSPGGPCRCPRRWPRSSRAARSRRGTTTTVTGRPGHGATTLALALWPRRRRREAGVPPSACPTPAWWRRPGSGSICAGSVFGPTPARGWAEAAGDLLSGVDAVLARPPGRVRLTAAPPFRAPGAGDRQARLVVPLERAAGAGPKAATWRGRWLRSRGKASGRGHGYLRGRCAEVRGERAPRRRPGHRMRAVAPGRLGVVEDGRTEKWRNGRHEAGRPGWAGPGRKARGGLSGWWRRRRGTVCRHLVPQLLEEGPRGEEARRFARVAGPAKLSRWCIRSGSGSARCRLRGPARFFGGEQAVVRSWPTRVGEEATSAWPTASSPRSWPLAPS